MSKRVYLASPFFNEVQVERMEKVRDILRARGLEVFVPNEHQNDHLKFGSIEWRESTFASDVKGIYTADVVVAIIEEGNFSDSGTAWEIGYAFAKDIPVIVVNTTGQTINLMIADSLRALITSDEELEGYDFDTLPRKPYTDYVW